MEILINDEPIDVTLESEKTVGEVLDGIDSWLAGSHMTVTAFALDSASMAAQRTPELTSQPIDSVNTLRVQARTQPEAQANALQTILEFVTTIRAALSEKRDELVRDLLSDWQHVAGSTAMAELFRADAQSLLDELGGVVDEAVRSDTTDSTPRREAITRLDQLATIISGRLHELAQPAQEEAATAGLLSTLLPRVAEISVLLQSGKDREAMDLVVRFTELTGKLLRLRSVRLAMGQDVTLPSSGATAEEFGAELNEMLGELLTAFDSRDSVLIGDLLEYEIVPRIEQVVAASSVEKRENE